MSIDKGSSTDDRQISQNPSSSGGQGGLFGNASAAIGDVGIGTSSATSGDATSSVSKQFSFAGPVVNKVPEWVTYAGLALAAFYVFKRVK